MPRWRRRNGPARPQLVHEQHAVMGERDLDWGGVLPQPTMPASLAA
jgi:hypothetical protein